MELNVQANVKTKNGKKLKIKALVDSRYTHTGIDEQLVKDKKIQTKPINFSFEVFNTNRTIKFTRCPGNCTMKHEDI